MKSAEEIAEDVAKMRAAMKFKYGRETAALASMIVKEISVSVAVNAAANESINPARLMDCVAETIQILMKFSAEAAEAEETKSSRN
jgi:hypothetical protein